MMFNDSREALVEVSLQLLIVVLDYDMEQQQIIENVNNMDQSFEVSTACFYRLALFLVVCLFL